MSNIPSANESDVDVSRIEDSRSDPQVVVTGRLKEGKHSDVIIFNVDLMLFEITAIVTVPAEGTKFAPVYLKLRVKR